MTNPNPPKSPPFCDRPVGPKSHRFTTFPEFAEVCPTHHPLPRAARTAALSATQMAPTATRCLGSHRSHFFTLQTPYLLGSFIFPRLWYNRVRSRVTR